MGICSIQRNIKSDVSKQQIFGNVHIKPPNVQNRAKIHHNPDEVVYLHTQIAMKLFPAFVIFIPSL